MTIDSTKAYALGASDAERARLLGQGELLRPEAEALIDRIGVEPGWRTIDIGCGPLGVLDILVDRVGPSATVVGLDNEPRMLELAMATRAERDLPTVELVDAEAAHTGLASESFDLVHERLVLLNIPSPGDVVAEMVRLARPGGYVALQDFDGVSWLCHPPSLAWDRLISAFWLAWRDAGLVPQTGRCLSDMLRHAELVDIHVDAHLHVLRPGNPQHKLLLDLLGTFRERILAIGALTEDELDTCTEELAIHLERPDSFTLYPTLVQAWGRKPNHAQRGGSG
jgi:ubiquinone/menaquinone biosynthesis C-methylase UbiE